jgi:hypothetical protein
MDHYPKVDSKTYKHASVILSKIFNSANNSRPTAANANISIIRIPKKTNMDSIM